MKYLENFEEGTCKSLEATYAQLTYLLGSHFGSLKYSERSNIDRGYMTESTC